MADNFDHPQLAKLSAGARAKVEAALNETLSRELAATTVSQAVDPAGLAAAHSRSQGAFFSRSKTTDQMLRDDRVMIDKVSTMDDAAFDQFASRLAKIKGMKTK